MQVVQSFPYLDLIWDVESRAMIAQWKGGSEGRDIRQGLDAGLSAFKRKRPYAQWIGDTTYIGSIAEPEKGWVDRDWFPRFLSTGVEFMAVVMPASAVAKLSVKNIILKIEDSKLTVFNCATLEEARTWMQSQRF